MAKDVVEVYLGLEPEPHLVVLLQRGTDVLGHRAELGDPKDVYRLIGSLRSAAQLLWGDKNSDR